jgi:hypothetical protein
MNNRTLAIIGASVLGTLLLILTLLYVLRPEARQAGRLPAETVKQVEGFTVYYPNPLPKGFSLDKETVSYDNGVLAYRLVNATRQSVVVSEQAAPKDLSASTIVGKESVPTSYGTATISLVDGRTMGYLLTKDKRTLIIMNTGDKVESATFKDLLRALQPVKP